ncbi:asparagine--tRNA ligase [Candidatus Riesia pediculischaeffi]|uniref:Asparagine--tRNA ligase n=1 Tax=Candidatus Riesia pediculischaeffi PTSU TaxID=1401651 RepID=A0A0C1RZZ3_9ENTR|nr:asparagine--tRNA ligase [Candidatus Riesia pediculischaeffi]KIE63872.1 Asparaginyl-tRNA synthetase [Candidatus Riesia pediculischaeffi PTSU]
MTLVSIADIFDRKVHLGEEIKVQGWVKSRRDYKGFSFIDMYDGSCLNFLQIIVRRELVQNYQTEILSITTGFSLEVTGVLSPSIGKDQKFELLSTDVKIIGKIKNPESYPISIKKHSFEYLREVAHLRPRTNIIGSVSRIRSDLIYFIHSFLRKEGYFLVSTPIITTVDTEKSSKMFFVSSIDLDELLAKGSEEIDFDKDFFGIKTFLTVSGQLNLEAYACSLRKVYSFGPTFRAEPSTTMKHLAEFWMLEVEASFLNLSELIEFSEKMLKYLFRKIADYRKQDLLFLSKKTGTNILKRLDQFIQSDVIQVEYYDVIKILNKKRFNVKSLEKDISSEQERYLTERYFKNSIVIKNHPKSIKPFYMKTNKDQKTVASMDLLLPKLGEIVGGSQREENFSIIHQNMIEKGINVKNYEWYLDLRRYGTVPHSGFGLGFERLVSYITGMKNVRDVIPFPRTMRNARF